MSKSLLKTLALSAVLFAGSGLKAQVLFSEDFDGIPGPTSGGAGTYVFPSGWSLRNVDNLTPNSSVSYVNEAWERREDFNFNVADSAAFSTSWYTPAGVSNDFMWTPAIGPLPANCVLNWNAVAYDPAYADGYEVRIMTVAPTGGTGVIGNQLTSSTVLFSTAAENTAWTARSVNLNAYAGQTVYIGFRNTSNDKFLLLIDDVTVQVLVNIDAEMTFADTATEYTIIPKGQAPALNFNGTITNNGANALSNVSAHVNVFDGSMSNIYSASSTPVGTLASGGTTNWTIPSFTPPATPDIYTVQYIANQTTGTDQNHGNDTLYQYFLIDDSTYARDDASVVGGLGIGAGVVGYIGQDFEILNPTVMTSISMYVTRGYTGRQFAAVVWDMPAGVPSSVIGGTDTLLYPDDSADFYTIPISLANGLLLNPGRYAVTMVEFDSTLSVGQTNEVFTNGTTWVNWPGSPLGGWGNMEAFGNQFAKSLVIRPNFACNVAATATSTNASCATCADGTATAAVTGGTGNFSYSWAPSGGTAAVASGLLPGTYSVTAMDNNTGCSTTTTVSVHGCDLSIAGDSTQASCSTCADGSVTVNIINGTPASYLWMPGNYTTQTVGVLLPGTYTVTVTDIYGCVQTDVVTVDFNTSVTNDAPGTPKVNVSPNPATNLLNFNIGLVSSEEMTITMTNVLGEVVYTDMHTGSNYTNQINLDGFAKGVYFFEVKTETASKTIRVVVQ